MPPRYDVPNAAPEPLRLVQRFVNTVDHERERDTLSTQPELSAWLREAQLLRRARPTAEDVRRARELREAVRAFLAANREGVAPSATAAAVVTRAARAGKLGASVDSAGQPVLTPAGPGVAGALARIVAVALSAMLDGSWTRLKACRNCGWAFYDYSRNRSATWCSMSICGNRIKTRRYRAARS